MLNKSYVQDHYRAIKIAFRYLMNAPLTTAMSLFAMGICLALPMSLYLFIKNIQNFSQNWEQHASMTIYVEGKSSLQQVNHILLTAKKHPFVKKATYINPDMGLKEFEHVSHMKDVLALLKENPLPGAITIELNSKKVTQQELEIMKNHLSRLPKVISVSFDYNWVQKLQAILTLGKALMHFLYLLISVGVTLVVSNTIRLALERHQDEIEVLTLVGATEAFIRRPFLYRGTLLGILAGFIALLILGFGFLFLHQSTATFVSLFQGIFRPQSLSFNCSLLFLTISACLGWVGAGLALTQQRAMPFKNEYTRRRLS
jgi:cell division transport system permease protein